MPTQTSAGCLPLGCAVLLTERRLPVFTSTRRCTQTLSSLGPALWHSQYPVFVPERITLS